VARVEDQGLFQALKMLVSMGGFWRGPMACIVSTYCVGVLKRSHLMLGWVVEMEWKVIAFNVFWEHNDFGLFNGSSVGLSASSW
jgi:hypothetical protein